MIYLSDKIYRQFEVGIRHLLRALHELDIPTYESCQGHLRPAEKDSFPNVYINGSSSLFEPNNLLKLIEILASWNQKREKKWQWIIEGRVFNDGKKPSQLFRLRPLQINGNRSSIILSHFRKDALDLANFIQQRRD